MLIEVILGSLATISQFLFAVQSLRLYRKIRITPSLQFSVYFTLASFGTAIIAVSSFLDNARAFSAYTWVLSLQAAALAWYLAYTMLRSRLVIACMSLVGSALVLGLNMTLAGKKSVALALVVVICFISLGATITTVVRIKDSIAQWLSTARLLLLSGSLLLLAWQGLLLAQGEAWRIIAARMLTFLYVSAILNTILVLTSFLTPIGSRDSVKRSGY